MVELATATRVARQLVSMLEDSCERVEIAGSIRRGKPQVKDIEIVAVPKLLPVKASGQLNLFKGQETAMVNQLDERLDGWLQRGMFKRRLDRRDRSAWGSSYKRAEYWGVAVDLFSVLAPAQWGLIYMIRTGAGVGPEGNPMNGFGPAMLARWKQVSSGGYSKGGCLHLPGGRPVPTPEEEDVFEACKVRWVPPEERTDAGVVGRYVLAAVL